jgi:hypothetical protein
MQKIQLRGDFIFIIREFLTRPECEEFIRTSENLGYEEAPVTTSTGFQMRKEIRDNSRVIVDDAALADRLWHRAWPHLVPTWSYRKPVGLNERFRFYRYGPQQTFRAHFDGSFARENGERSEFTFLVYLNEDFVGGETVFFEPETLRVRPETGLALVFQHPQLHEGAVIESGTKYVLRTDVMYGGDA